MSKKRYAKLWKAGRMPNLARILKLHICAKVLWENDAAPAVFASVLRGFLSIQYGNKTTEEVRQDEK